ncbi:hypothetical protein H2200_013655 [Cladophialophora chaetospira]|uniref:Uncharacterized protein n=1 Tax=Cladophialophora chaetospira TaxID=386627 RepID=A0AA38WVY6_9EURO|nr:hypothetical protein H2200_013655 [Cladophialophora chaetospira]
MQYKALLASLFLASAVLAAPVKQRDLVDGLTDIADAVTSANGAAAGSANGTEAADGTEAANGTDALDDLANGTTVPLANENDLNLGDLVNIGSD